MIKTVIVWIAVAIAALAINSTFAQAVPKFEDGAWILPANDPSMAAPAGQFGGGVEQWRPAVEGACGGDASCANWMLSVIACESGGDAGAIGAQGEVGILQFHPQGLWGAIWDPGTQIQIAADAYYSGLRFHWTCSPW